MMKWLKGLWFHKHILFIYNPNRYMPLLVQEEDGCAFTEMILLRFSLL